MDFDLTSTTTRRHTGAFGGESVLCPATLRELLDVGGPPLLADLARLFLEDAEVRVADLVAALDRGDLDGVRTAAHALKSGAASVGALPLSGALQQLESEAGSGDEDRAAKLVVHCCGMLPEVRRALVELADRIQPPA